MIGLNSPRFILPLPLVIAVAFGGAVYPDTSGTLKIILQAKNEGKKKGGGESKDSSSFWGRVSQGREREMAGCFHLAGV